MKTLTKSFFLAGVIAIVSLMMKCGIEKPSGISDNNGGSTSDVDGIVCGILYEPGGEEPARGASVVLRSSDYLAEIPLMGKRTTISGHFVCRKFTDTIGYYRFTSNDSIPEGTYCIEGRDSSNNCVLIDSVMIAADGIYSPKSDTLKPPGAIHGTIPRNDDSSKAVVRVFGLDTFAEVKSDGTYSIENIPAGNLRLQFCVVRGSAISYDTLTVVTEANDTLKADTLFSLPEIVAMSDTLLQINAGGSCSLSVTAKGKPEPSYQWYKDTSFLHPDSNGVLIITNATEADSGVYRCYAVNQWGTVKSLPMRLEVINPDGMQDSDDISLAAVCAPSIGGAVTTSKSAGSASSDSGGDSIWITAHAATGYRFVGWTGDTGIAHQRDTAILVVMNQNMSLTANFIKQFTLTLAYTGNGSVSPEGAIIVDSGVATTITAVANFGFELRAWRVASGKAIIEDSTATITSVRLLSDAGVIGMFRTLTFIKTFGGIGDDIGNSVRQTSDGGYIITGSTNSFGAGDSDVYLIKTDAEGNATWTKTFGGDSGDVGNSVRQTSDGGYIIVGSTKSFGAGNSDVYLIKTDAEGNETWTKTFGGDEEDFGNSVRQTDDGGYIIVGSINYGAVYLIKTDAAGNESWKKTFSDGATFIGNYVQQTSEGGYIITAYHYTAGASIKLIKTDAAGNETWLQTLGGGTGNLVQQTSDGGYVLFGYDGGRYGSTACLLKTDVDGNETWRKTFSNCNGFYSGQQTDDGGYIISGLTSSYNAADSSYSAGVYLVKTDAVGNESWTKTFSGAYYDYGNSVQQTNDGGYIVTGGVGTGGRDGGINDVYLIKTDENGDVK